MRSEKNENIYYNWKKIDVLVKTTTRKIKLKNKKYDAILGIKHGGIIPTKLISKELKIENIKFISIKNKQIIIDEFPSLKKNEKYLVIDEIFDSGYTYKIVYNIIKDFDHDFVVLISRYKPENKKVIFGELLNHDKWIIFPWEK